MCLIALFVSIYLSLGLAIIETTSPESTATVTPPAQAVSPPVIIPINPYCCIASLTPFASEFQSFSLTTVPLLSARTSIFSEFLSCIKNSLQAPHGGKTFPFLSTAAIPINPYCCIASLTPFASEFPNPVKGIVQIHHS